MRRGDDVVVEIVVEQGPVVGDGVAAEADDLCQRFDVGKRAAGAEDDFSRRLLHKLFQRLQGGEVVAGEFATGQAAVDVEKEDGVGHGVLLRVICPVPAFC